MSDALVQDGAGPGVVGAALVVVVGVVDVGRGVLGGGVCESTDLVELVVRGGWDRVVAGVGDVAVGGVRGARVGVHVGVDIEGAGGVNGRTCRETGAGCVAARCERVDVGR